MLFSEGVVGSVVARSVCVIIPFNAYLYVRRQKKNDIHRRHLINSFLCMKCRAISHRLSMNAFSIHLR